MGLQQYCSFSIAAVLHYHITSAHANGEWIVMSDGKQDSNERALA